VSPSGDWLLYGANGYTGRLIAEEAARRGMRPILAGRNTTKIGTLADQCGCPSRVFDLGNANRVVENLRGVAGVLHCAGPFSATSAPMVDACLRAGVHYLDITGEIDVIEEAAARHDDAVGAGVTLMPAVGFDVVPSDCLAAMLAQRLPGATHLQLAFTGTGRPSAGTAKTMLEALPHGGRIRRDGRIMKVPPAYRSMQIPFPAGRRWAATIPWGDVATAYHSTGIPNIEVYMAMPQKRIRALRRARFLLPLLRLGFLRRLLRNAVQTWMAGGTEQGPKSPGAELWGKVTDPHGNAAEASLKTPPPYRLTALTVLGCLEKTLAGAAPTGFTTPAKAFGPDYILGFPGTKFRWLSAGPPNGP